MTGENSVQFEGMLQQELKQITCNEVVVSAVKRGLKFRFEKQWVAELSFQYLMKSHSFVLLGRVFGGPIFEGMANLEMPYKSNLMSDACLSFTTSGRQDKKFASSLYGDIAVPRPEQAKDVCMQIRRALEAYYVPLIVGCIVPGERTIEDVIYTPTDYAYPAAFIHSAVMCNPSLLNDALKATLKTHRKIIKHKAFDFALLGIETTYRGCAIGKRLTLNGCPRKPLRPGRFFRNTARGRV